jgi:beta-xylosidase
MKNLIIPALLICTVLQTVAQPKSRAGNPVFPGWYADPEGVIFDGRYWIYPTYSAPYREQVFMDAFSSPDLVNWTKHSRVVDTAAVKWVNRAMWAPAIVHKDGKYFLFFAGNDIQNDEEYGGIGIGVADRPEGPFRDYLGKPLIDKFHNGAQPIDQYVFRDSDGSYYMYYGGWRHCNVAKLNADFTGFEPLPSGEIFKEVTPKGYVEGPFMFVRNGKYYFMWSEGGWTGPNYSVAYAIADSPFGPFNRVARILQSDPEIANGSGHHSVIHEPKSDRYYMVYHRRPITETEGNHRQTCIDEMTFDEQGFIQPVKITVEGVERNVLDLRKGNKAKPAYR